MAAINFAEYFGIEPRFVDSTFIGGASNVAHLDMAAPSFMRGCAKRFW